MSNIGGPISPTEQLTFELHRLMRLPEAGGGSAFLHGAAHSGAAHSEEAHGVGTADPAAPFVPMPSGYAYHHQFHQLRAAERASASSGAGGGATAAPSGHSGHGGAALLPPVSTFFCGADADLVQPVHALATLSPTSFFAIVVRAVANSDWPRVAAACERFAALTVPSAALSAADAKALRHHAIDMVQDEFEAAFATKNIKRRADVLRVVAHAFAAKLLPEKVAVAAYYRALGGGAGGAGPGAGPATATTATAIASAPPLHALLAVARALTVAAASFTTVGLQHLPHFITLLCHGLITTAPNAEQHEELCDAIRRTSAVLHGFHPASS
jgi:hypothetical protein